VDGRETRNRRKELTIVARGRVEITDQPRRVAPRRVNESIEMETVHRLEHSSPHGVAVFCVRLTRGRIGPLLRRLLRHFQVTLIVWMEPARLYNLRQTPERNAITPRGEIAVQIIFETHACCRILRAHKGFESFHRCRIDDGRTHTLQVLKCSLKKADDL